MASALKPMDVDGREEAETQLYLKGPLSVLTSSVKTNSVVRFARPVPAARVRTAPLVRWAPCP